MIPLPAPTSQPRDPAVDQREAAEQIELVVLALPGAVLATLFLELMLCIALWNHVSRSLLGAWVGITLTLGAGGFLLRQVHLRVPPAPHHVGPWRRDLMVFALLTGATWGAGLFLLPPGILELRGLFLLAPLWGEASAHRSHAPITESRRLRFDNQDLAAGLAAGDPSAEATLNDLSQALGGSGLGGVVQPVGEALEGFDFKAATEALEPLGRALGGRP